MITDYAAQLWMSFARPVGNHLWQSTAFAAVAALLSLALRKHNARVRHGLWLAASIKFLIPFAAVAALGSRMASWWTPATPELTVSALAVKITEPFVLPDAPPIAMVSAAAPLSAPLWPLALLAVWLLGAAAIVIHWRLGWHRMSATVRAARRLHEGREIEALRRIQKGGSDRVRLVSSPGLMEPGLFGIFRPVLWIPAGVAGRLTDAELESILAHEVCHLRRRDNLFAAIHMAVEALFWFHPLVWWLGARLTEERELACDEEVIRLGGEPQTYAESILKICEFCLSSPVACAAGVTGGGLKGRVESIMANPFRRDLSFANKALLALGVLIAAAAPVTVGIFRAQAAQPGGQRLAFDVVSIKPDRSGNYGGAGDGVPGTRGPSNGRWRWKRIPLPILIQYAYDVRREQIFGVPDYFQRPETAFNIEAKFPPETTAAQFRSMLGSLLADRFQFSMHRETRNVPAIALEIAKTGLKLKRASGDCVEHLTKSSPEQYPCGVFQSLLHSAGQWGSKDPSEMAWEFVGRSVSMAQIAAGFTYSAPVVDVTGVKGIYDIDVKVPFHPHQLSNDADERFNNEVEFNTKFRSCFEKQAGLVIDLSGRKKLPVPVIVVDRVEKPTEN
jgi:uncharacterized protein (TIGR03435 family)